MSGSGSSHNVRGRQEALCSVGWNLFSEKYDQQKYEVSKMGQSKKRKLVKYGKQKYEVSKM